MKPSQSTFLLLFFYFFSTFQIYQCNGFLHARCDQLSFPMQFCLKLKKKRNMDLLPLLGYYNELRLNFTKNKYALLINAPPPPQTKTNKQKKNVRTCWDKSLHCAATFLSNKRLTFNRGRDSETWWQIKWKEVACL